MVENSKSRLDTYLTPLMIAIVGTIGTYFITHHQNQNAKLSMNVQIESSERLAKSAQQLKILEIFSSKITSKNIKEREIAVRILSTLDQDLSQKLAKVIIESSADDTLIRNIATQFLTTNYYVIIGSYAAMHTAISYANLIKQKKISYEVKIYKSNNNKYAVCLGDPISLNEANDIKSYALTHGINTSYIKFTETWDSIDY